MISFPHAKVNLGLNVLRKRDDGYHDIESVLVPIPLSDVLEAVVDLSLEPGGIIFSRSGLEIPGKFDGDLCWRAAKAIIGTRAVPGIRLHLHKVIPMGAGLGGGSSDGAHTLVLLNDLLNVGLNKTELHKLAADLGSDCPFFLEKQAQFVTGRGELLEPIDLDLSGLHMVLVNPGIHVPTPEVYTNTVPTEKESDLRELLQHGRPSEWQGTVFNSLERYVFTEHTEIAKIKSELLEHGASYAAMSGSGSSVFGLFNAEPKSLTFPVGYRHWSFAL